MLIKGDAGIQDQQWEDHAVDDGRGQDAQGTGMAQIGPQAFPIVPMVASGLFREAHPSSFHRVVETCACRFKSVFELVFQFVDLVEKFIDIAGHISLIRIIRRFNMSWETLIN